MINAVKWPVIVFIVAFIGALALLSSPGVLFADQPLQRLMPCTEAWYAHVESVVSSGDGRGHGPDIGSAEWKSVIEFRLGVWDDAGNPDRASVAWCEFIDERVRGMASSPKD